MPSSPYMHASSSTHADGEVALDSQELVRDALHAIVTGRKSWKTIRGKSEAVWPPYLEQALIEGLEKYRQTEGLRVSALGGGRFPMRNRFISEYIQSATGKRRTPKQVGSRLQQLRDTSGGKQVLKLLSDRSDPHSSLTSASDSTSASSRSSTEPDSSSHHSSTSFQRTIVDIPILPPSSPNDGGSGSSTPSNSNYSQSNLCSNAPSPVSEADTLVSPVSPTSAVSSAFPSSVHASTPPPSCLFGSPHDHRYHHHSSHSSSSAHRPRPLRAIDPTVTFLSKTLLPGRDSSEHWDSQYFYFCEFSISFDGSEGEVHRETGRLELVEERGRGRTGEGGGEREREKGTFLYRTTLVPEFWERLCESSDPTRYSISQDIIRKPRERSSSSSPSPSLTRPSSSSSYSSSRERSEDDRAVVLSVMYRFCYPRRTRPASPLGRCRPSTSSSTSSFLSDPFSPPSEDPDVRGRDTDFAFSFGLDTDPGSVLAPLFDSSLPSMEEQLFLPPISQPPLLLPTDSNGSGLPLLSGPGVRNGGMTMNMASWSPPVTPVDPVAPPPPFGWNNNYQNFASRAPSNLNLVGPNIVDPMDMDMDSLVGLGGLGGGLGEQWAGLGAGMGLGVGGYNHLYPYAENQIQQMLLQGDLISAGVGKTLDPRVSAGVDTPFLGLSGDTPAAQINYPSPFGPPGSDLDDFGGRGHGRA